MKFAEVIVKILEKQNIVDIFGIPGAGINPVYKYLNASKKIRHYTMRHEESAAHAAGAYYRASGKLAVCMTTSGPGATNLVTGLYTNYIDSIPTIAITGQAVSTLLGKDAFQCVDIAAICKPICKETYCITSVDKGVQTIKDAFTVAQSGKPGPVLIDIPLDVQMAEVNFDIDDFDIELPEKPSADPRLIKEAINMISNSKNPVIIMGGGVNLADACSDLVQFAECIQAPVITTYMAKGCIPEKHPLNVGHMGIQVGQPIGNRVFLESDLVIGIGNRFTDRHTGAIDVYRGKRKFIHINIEQKELNKIFVADLSIHSDAKIAIKMLSDHVNNHCDIKPSDRVLDLEKQKKYLKRKSYYDQTPIMPQRVFHEINNIFDDDTIFTTGCGITQIWSGQFQEINKPRRYLPSGGAGTLGYDIPAAFGAMISEKSKSKAVAIIGDFGFTFHAQELAVASKFNVPLIVIIINNAYLGLIRQNQNYAYDYEYAVEMSENQEKIDFLKVAQGLGCKAERVIDPNKLSEAFKRAIDSDSPYVIDVFCDCNADCSMGLNIESIKEFQ